jgi:hypothetical protein
MLINGYKSLRGLDSFKLLIPFDKVDGDYRLISTITSYYTSTGEIYKDDTNQYKPLCIKDKGFDTHYGVIKLFGNDYVYVLLNSKMLKSNYFTSINSDSIDELYLHVKRQNIIDVNYEDFVNCKLTDIDIKSDFEMYDEQFYDFCSVRKKALVYPKFHSNRPNIGLEYTKRHSATPSNPYVKYYSKSSELFTRSSAFRTEYLPNFYNENLRRCEVTIKNHDHKLYIERKLFKLPQTLSDWCSLSQHEYWQIIDHCVRQHEEHVQIPVSEKEYLRNVNSLTSRDYMFFKMYSELSKLGLTDLQILGLYDQRSDKPIETHYNERSRINKLIRKVREVNNNKKSLINPF